MDIKRGGGSDGCWPGSVQCRDRPGSVILREGRKEGGPRASSSFG